MGSKHGFWKTDTGLQKKVVDTYMATGSIYAAARKTGVSWNTASNIVGLCAPTKSLSEMVESIKPKPIKVKQRKKAYRTREEVNLMMSDLHYGGRHTASQTLGLAEYNVKTAEKRVEILAEKFLGILDILGPSYKFNTMNLILMGDMMDGEAIWQDKVGGTLNVENGGAEQLIGCTELIAGFVKEIGERFNAVRCYCLIGNHPRAANKVTYLNNLDFFMYKMLQYKFDGTHIKVFPMTSWLGAFMLNGHMTIAAHGDYTRSWGQFPMYGIVRDTLKTMGMLNKVPEYALYAHHHSQTHFNISNVEVLVNGSMIGGTEFGVSRFKAIERPSQWMFGMHEREGMTWQFNLRLAKMNELRPDENDILTPYSRI